MWNPDQPRITRSILMIEMSDGTQYGYDVAVHRATIALDPPEMIDIDPYRRHYAAEPRHGTVTVEGRFQQVVVRAGTFTEQPAIEPDRPALPAARQSIEARSTE